MIWRSRKWQSRQTVHGLNPSAKVLGGEIRIEFGQRD